MMEDPIIKEIRKIRHEIEADCGNDADRYFQHLQEIQKKCNALVCRRPKKRLQIKALGQEMSVPV
ncbi:MAG: hypothetical protein V2B19_25845 [Pseudomonadota bacterium]